MWKSPGIFFFKFQLMWKKNRTNSFFKKYFFLFWSLLTCCICVWFSSCTVAERKELQRLMSTILRIVGCPLPPLPSLAVLYSSHRLSKANNIRQGPISPRELPPQTAALGQTVQNNEGTNRQRLHLTCPETQTHTPPHVTCTESLSLFSTSYLHLLNISF